MAYYYNDGQFIFDRALQGLWIAIKWLFKAFIFFPMLLAPFVEDRTYWNFKLSGSYDAPWNIRLSPVVRHQSGTNFAREISVPSSAARAFGLIYSGTIYAEPANARRRDNIWVFDVRAEKTVSFTDRVRTRLFLDLFNLTNSSAAEAVTVTTGGNFLRPSTILAPRTARVGFRFLW